MQWIPLTRFNAVWLTFNKLSHKDNDNVNIYFMRSLAHFISIYGALHLANMFHSRMSLVLHGKPYANS